MKSHSWTALGGVAAAAGALLMLSGRPPVAEVAVDLRSAPAARAATSAFAAKAPPAPSPKLKYQLLAERCLLAEFREEARQLESESLYLSADADSLWATWRSRFGGGGGFIRPYGVAGGAANPAAEQEALHLQSELFNLKSQAQNVRENARMLSAEVEAADRRWLALAGMIIDREGSDAFYAESISDLLGEIRPLAGRVAALDSNVRTRQGDVDRLYPGLNKYMRQNLPNPPDLARSRHWFEYMLRDRPRPEFQADFDRRYAAALEEARDMLKAPPGRLPLKKTP